MWQILGISWNSAFSLGVKELDCEPTPSQLFELSLVSTCYTLVYCQVLSVAQSLRSQQLLQRHDWTGHKVRADMQACRLQQR